MQPFDPFLQLISSSAAILSDPGNLLDGAAFMAFFISESDIHGSSLLLAVTVLAWLSFALQVKFFKVFSPSVKYQVWLV
jgi:hypothetical protein